MKNVYVTFSLDPVAADRLEKLAKKSGMNKSEFIREAIRYFWLVDNAGLLGSDDDGHLCRSE